MEQSATPWRVFDAPGTDAEPESGGPAAGSRRPKPGGGLLDLASPGGRLVLAGTAGALVIAIVAAAIVLAGAGERLIEGPDRSSVGSNDTTLLAAAGQVIVDVAGAVVRPGVYRLSAGARIGDAVDAAGGFSPRVDAVAVAATLNLAAPLVDGSRIHVPARDEPSGPDGGGATGGGSPGSAGGTLVNLNTASQAELEALPGIGPVTATKIIEARSSEPFRSIGELRERKLVGEKTFSQLQALVTVN